MRKTILLLVCVFIYLQAYSQKEAAHWYFGNYAGIDFTDLYTASNVTVNGVANQTLSGIPKFESGPISTWEGCFSISDRNGNFLFASDGRKVYNKLKQQMPHGAGLRGHNSTAQSGIFIPRPEHPNNYYIVTASCNEDATGAPVMYYEVNLELDNGKGDVLGPYTSNVPNGIALNYGGVFPATQKAGENIAAVGHSNGIDYWLTHHLGAYFFVWKVTKDGINPTPTHIIQVPDITPSAFGYTKFSSDGKYMVATSYNHIVVGNFDTTTGLISNIKNKAITGMTAYSFALSPDNKYIYYVDLYGNSNLRRLSLNSIISGIAETPISYTSFSLSNVQIGPDERIYGIGTNANTASKRHLYIILDPNEVNPTTAIVPYFFPDATLPGLGLPTFTSSFFGMRDLKANPANPCENNEVELSIKINPGTGSNSVKSIKWDFGDGTAPVIDTNMNQFLFMQKHTYEKRGRYTLTLTPCSDVAGTQAIDNKIQTLSIKVSSCRLPVNHNISNMEY